MERAVPIRTLSFRLTSLALSAISFDLPTIFQPGRQSWQVVHDRKSRLQTSVSNRTRSYSEACESIARRALQCTILAADMIFQAVVAEKVKTLCHTHVTRGCLTARCAPLRCVTASLGGLLNAFCRKSQVHPAGAAAGIKRVNQ